MMILHREQLLIHAKSSDPDLQMLLKLFDLLASCCEGENLFIESICQNVMGISEVLKVVLKIYLLSDNYFNPYIDFVYA